MTEIFIFCGLVAYLNSSKTLLDIFHIEPSRSNLIIYVLLGFIVSGFLMFFNYDSASKGAISMFVLYVVGLTAQIAYWYFKKPGIIEHTNR